MIGLRVAKEGEDATRGDGKKLAFTSEAQSLKISDDFHDVIRTVTVNSASNVTLNINHSLLRRPVFRLFVEAVPGSGKWYNDSNSLDALDVSGALAWKIIDITRSKITLFFIVPQACTFRFKFWIFDDSLDPL